MARRYDDDDEDEKPSKSRTSRRYEDDDEDERPARRSRSRDDDDDEDERPARRSRSRDDDDEEDEKPARRRRRDEEDEDEDEKPRRRRSRDDDDDDEDTKPKKPRVVPKNLKGGWGAADKVKSDSSSYANRVKVTTKEQLIKFLEDAPYVSYAQHWIPRTGQQSFICIAKEDPKGCPLCDSGDSPAARVCFNVAMIDEDGGDPVLMSLEASSTTAESIKNYHNEPRTGPISKHYWAIKKASDKKTATTVLNMVRERDLDEEWQVDPITPEQIKALKKEMYGPDIVNLPSRKQLLEIVAEDGD